MGRINNTWLERRKGKTPTVQTVVDLPADALLKSVNDTADNARNLFVTYILLSVYIFLTVGATNDEQLFRDSGVAVPFLNNINLPVSRFYQFVPWMFLFIHVDLLLLFKLMADKLHAFNAELADMEPPEAEEYRQQLNGLPFVHWLAGDQTDGFSHFITGVVVWTSLFLLPLLTLLALQIGFLPYHSDFTTGAHQVILLLDALALLWFWPRLVAEKGRQTWRWWLPVGMNAVAVGRNKPAPAGVSGKPPDRTPETVAVRPYSGLRFTVLLAWWEKTKASVLSLLRRLKPRLTQRITPETAPKPSVCRWRCRTVSVVMLLGSLWFGGFVAVLPGERLEDNGLLVHWLMDGADTAKPDEEEVQKVTNLPWYYSVQPQLPLLHRNLDLHEKLLVANDPDLETLANLQEPELKQQERLILLVKIKGLDLQNRDLRFANLAEAKLWKADLRGAKMQQARLSSAQLQGIQWGTHAQLQGANLREAELQGADLKQAKLLDANLIQAKLQGADLKQAKLLGADLTQAKLQGADLREAELQGANLWGAKLQGANLRGAKLQGANLIDAHVGSADLSQATFAFNDFRRLQTLPLFTQQDFEAWKRNSRGLQDEDAAKVRDLQSRVGKATAWPTEAIVAPCLADRPSAAPLQNCLAANPDYYQALANYWGDLACRANEKLKGQDFIAKGIARRRIGYDYFDDWGKEGQSARRRLAQRLLNPDCAGQADLTDNQRAALRKLAAAP